MLIATALALAGCEHLYGSIDTGHFSRSTKARPSEAAIVAIAERKLVQEGRSVEGLAPTITDLGDAWRVRFGPAEAGVLDGGVTVEISKKTRRAGRWWADA